MDVAHITKSVENYDEIVDWQQKLASSSDENEFYSISAKLVQVYGKLSKDGVFSANSKQGQKIAAWLSEQLEDFWMIVLASLNSHAEVGSSVALKIVLISGKYQGLSIHDKVAQLVAKMQSNPNVLEIVHGEFVKYDDLRFQLLASLPETVTSAEHAQTLLPLLCSFDKTVETDRDLSAIFSTKEGLPFDQKKAALKYRQVWQQAWLHMLRQPLDGDAIKQVLTVMHARIVPNFTKPQLLMDFLVDAYDYGGAISLLALNAVFVLIQYHQLDYPQFFTKLYELLEDGSLLLSAHRARFLRLLDLFLTSTHLPATIPASIIKRLARLCLFAPPGAIVAILPFVYNQLKRHPTCMIMIHRNDAPMTPEGRDPFNNDEPDPLLTGALDSSLWELQSLTSHYHPNVAAIAKIFGQPFKKPQYQLEHFLSHSYETLYATEYNRKRDREPGLEFDVYNVFDDLSATWTYN